VSKGSADKSDFVDVTIKENPLFEEIRDLFKEHGPIDIAFTTSDDDEKAFVKAGAEEILAEDYEEVKVVDIEKVGDAIFKLTLEVDGEPFFANVASRMAPYDPNPLLQAAYAYLLGTPTYGSVSIGFDDEISYLDEENAPIWAERAEVLIQNILDESDDFSEVEVALLTWADDDDKTLFMLKLGYAGASLPDLKFHVVMDDPALEILWQAVEEILDLGPIIVDYVVGGNDGEAVADRATPIAQGRLSNPDFAGITVKVRYAPELIAYEYSFVFDLVIDDDLKVLGTAIKVDIAAPKHEVEYYIDPEGDLTIDEDFLVGLEVGMTREAIEDAFNLPAGWTFEVEGALEDGSLVTGAKITFFDGTGEEVDHLYAVVKGDLNGTGTVGPTDVFLLVNHLRYVLLGQLTDSVELSGAPFLAAILGGGDAPGITDLAMLVAMATAPAPAAAMNTVPYAG
jgi:hypothetical protein